jgi:hypothetical protein
MKIFKILLLISLAMIFCLVSCNDNNPTKGDTKYDGTLNATISGDLNLSFQCKEAYGLIVKPAEGLNGSMHIQGSVKQGSDTYMIDIQVYHDAAAGTYELSFPMSSGGGVASVAKNNTGNFSESGSVTFTQVSSTRMAGTFEFTAWRVDNVGQKITTEVASGSFNVPVISNIN